MKLYLLIAILYFQNIPGNIFYINLLNYLNKTKFYNTNNDCKNDINYKNIYYNFLIKYVLSNMASHDERFNYCYNY